MAALLGSDWTATLRPGMRVYVGGGQNEPLGLIEQLQAHPERAAGVTFYQFPVGGLNATDFSALHPDARMVTCFLTPALREGFAAGRVDYWPAQMRQVFAGFANGARFDVVMMQGAPGRDGVLRHGPNLDFIEAALSNTDAVALEINAGFVAPAGAPALAWQSPTPACESARPLAEILPGGPDDVSRRIGAHVASLIGDGACIQTGIGAIPAAVLEALSGHRDLGVHSGLIDDGVRGLIERGVITGARKSRDAGVHLVGQAIGSRAVCEWLADQPDVHLAGANVTHEVSVIRELDDFVSINSAVEVDLLGQINAEMAAGRQISGTGGSVDFMRAAKCSSGGRSIVAMPATARGGSTSRIVARLASGTAATALRTDVDCVVTEHGVAELASRTLRERADALIAIAAPEFRESLAAEWHTLARTISGG